MVRFSVNFLQFLVLCNGSSPLEIHLCRLNYLGNKFITIPKGKQFLKLTLVFTIELSSP